jgi:hypothetical protein
MAKAQQRVVEKQKNGQGVKLTIHPGRVPLLKMQGDVSSLHCVYSWRVT